MLSNRRFAIGLLLLFSLGQAAPAAPADSRALAATIDRLLAERWRSAGVLPAAPASDAEFVRRVYLDLAGRIPLTSEVRSFLEDRDSARRERLVERLLAGPAYVNHFSNVYRALLLPEADTNQVARYLAPGFQEWLRKQLADGVGYDRLVRSLLTVPFDTDQQQREQPFYRQPAEASPVAFYLAKGMKPEDLAAGTARLFLGVQLECAQCHNHPFAAWKRDQFWGLAAFFAGLQKQDPEMFMAPKRELHDRRELPVPGTAKVVQATFLDGTEPRWKFRTGARVTLADWVTAPDNPFFARAAVNRVWAYFFGTGFVEPVDDFGGEHPPSHPELLDELARAFVASGYNTPFLIRAVVTSQAYQLTSAATHPGQKDPRLFARMAVKALSAQQLYDSLVVASGFRDPEAAGRRSNNSFYATTRRSEFLAKFASHDSRTETQLSILQALSLMNGKLVADMTSLERSDTLAAVSEAPFLDTAQRIETLFLAALSRKPTAPETDRLVGYVTAGGPRRDARHALADVFWALLNSPEFVLNH